jgi:hypothetical protein
MLILYTIKFLILFFIILSGGFLCPLRFTGNKFSTLSEIFFRYCLGLFILSYLIISLGLFGLIRVSILGPILLLLLIIGIFRAYRCGFFKRLSLIFRSVKPIKENLISQFGKATLYIVSLWLFLLSLNIFIGAMVPDFSQDSMWYHLSIPGQWIIRQNAWASPNIMPSNYPLAAESIYAGILLFSDEILCSLLYSQVTLMLIFGMILAGFKYVKSSAGLLILISVIIFWATLHAVVPICSGNDNFAALLLFAAYLFLMQYRDFFPQKRTAIIFFYTGIFFGCAASAKLITIAFICPIVLFYFVEEILSHKKFNTLIRNFFLILCGIILAYLPWAIRGIFSTGNPVFPLAASLFSTAEGYEITAAASMKLNSLYSLNLSGLREAFCVGLFQKINFAMTGSDILLGLIFTAGLIILIIEKKYWRLRAIMLLSLYGAFFIMKGHNEVPRYFSICYPVSVALLTYMFSVLIKNMKKGMRIFFVSVIILGSIFTYTKKQIRVASFPTIEWKFRPVLSKEDRENFALHAETGGLYSGFNEVSSLIKKDAYVFLPDCNYPYYLKRRSYWWDPVCGPKMRPIWKKKSEEEAWEFIRKNKFDYILLTGRNTDIRLKNLKIKNRLKSIPLSSKAELIKVIE